MPRTYTKQYGARSFVSVHVGLGDLHHIGWAACVRMLVLSACWDHFCPRVSSCCFISTFIFLSQRSRGAADWLVWYTQWDSNRNGRNVRAIRASAVEELYCIWNLYNSVRSLTLITKEQRTLWEGIVFRLATHARFPTLTSSSSGQTRGNRCCQCFSSMTNSICWQ